MQRKNINYFQCSKFIIPMMLFISKTYHHTFKEITNGFISFRRNSHGVPKRTLLKMMERFEKGVTVEKLMKNVEITNLEYQSQPFGQQMDIGQHDGVVSAL